MKIDEILDEKCYKNNIILFDSNRFKEELENRSKLCNKSLNEFLDCISDEMDKNGMSIERRTIQYWMYGSGNPRDFNLLKKLCDIACINISQIFFTPYDKLFDEYKKIKNLDENDLKTSDVDINEIDKWLIEFVENRHVFDSLNDREEFSKIDLVLNNLMELKKSKKIQLARDYSILYKSVFACLFPLWVALVAGQNIVGVHTILKLYIFLFVAIVSIIFMALSAIFEFKVKDTYYENFSKEDASLIKWFLCMPFFYMMLQSIAVFNDVEFYLYMFDCLYLFLFALSFLGLFVFLKRNIRGIKLKENKMNS